jgi:hypothetical protein
MGMNDFIGLICTSDWGTMWFGPLSISWQNSMGMYSLLPRREWGNTLIIFQDREFLLH